MKKITKKISIVNGHPREVSFCDDLVEKYIEGARDHAAEIKILDLKDLALEPRLKYDWNRNHNSKPTSQDLERAKEFIAWSDHMVFAYPAYWAMPPALVALFIEMVIVSGFAFKYHKPMFHLIAQWDRLLKGRTATILSTMDAPPWGGPAARTAAPRAGVARFCLKAGATGV
ncbi:MAG TPA: NAD(P)H-dependent oxidoreductase [Patescibacteria group bacterium]|nr:NAD(P)H-dependent oxidoreductase [Patescibacteria group bacterium]